MTQYNNFGNVRLQDNLTTTLHNVVTNTYLVNGYHNLISDLYLQEFCKIIVNETQTTNLSIQKVEMYDTNGASIIRRGFTTIIRYANSILVSSYFGEIEGNPSIGNIMEIKYWCGACTDVSNSGVVLSTISTDITKTIYHTLTIDYIITLVPEGVI